MFFFFYLWNLIFWVAGWFGMWKVSLDKSDIFFFAMNCKSCRRSFQIIVQEMSSPLLQKVLQVNSTHPETFICYNVFICNSLKPGLHWLYIPYFFSDEIFFFPLAQVNLCIYLHCNSHYHNRWVLTVNRKHMFL